MLYWRRNAANAGKAEAPGAERNGGVLAARLVSAGGMLNAWQADVHHLLGKCRHRALVAYLEGQKPNAWRGGGTS